MTKLPPVKLVFLGVCVVSARIYALTREFLRRDRKCKVVIEILMRCQGRR